MVLLDRIELSTSPLPRECSTTELQQLSGGVLASHRLRRKCVSAKSAELIIAMCFFHPLMLFLRLNGQGCNGARFKAA
ncbi:hypothetical protein AA0482_0614 [Acetobacter cibinongensis NRIC 0482]|nr:hypothetical protein AA0482_0614 [Acetobacter cibinongensis NRIC 0482]